MLGMSINNVIFLTNVENCGRSGNKHTTQRSGQRHWKHASLCAVNSLWRGTVC